MKSCMPERLDIGEAVAQTAGKFKKLFFWEDTGGQYVCFLQAPGTAPCQVLTSSGGDMHILEFVHFGLRSGWDAWGGWDTRVSRSGRSGAVGTFGTVGRSGRSGRGRDGRSRWDGRDGQDGGITEAAPSVSALARRLKFRCRPNFTCFVGRISPWRRPNFTSVSSNFHIGVGRVRRPNFTSTYVHNAANMSQYLYVHVQYFHTSGENTHFLLKWSGC